jgi:hypothetical protein
VEAVRSIRIHLPDRPGALSSIGTALAVHDVNIARLHVVSHEGDIAVDDLDLTAESTRAIDRAIAGFHPDVRVEWFDSALGDPVLAAARGLGAVACAPTRDAALQAFAGWALNVVRADAGAVLEVTPDGIRPVAGAPLGGLSQAAAAAIRRATEDGMPSAICAASGERPLPFGGFGALHAAVAGCGPALALAVGRRSPVAFAKGELERLAAFAEAGGGILALK